MKTLNASTQLVSTMEASNASTQLIAIAVNKHKSGQCAFKWALDNLISEGQAITLVHVMTKSSNAVSSIEKEITSRYQILSKTKNVKLKVVVKEGTSVARAIVEFVLGSAIEKLVLGSSGGGLIRSFRGAYVSTNVLRHVPDFCSVYVMGKGGRVSSVRNAIRLVPAVPSSFRMRILAEENPAPAFQGSIGGESPLDARKFAQETGSTDSVRTTETRGGRNTRSTEELPVSVNEIKLWSRDGGPTIFRVFPPRLRPAAGPNVLSRSFESTLTPAVVSSSYTNGFFSTSIESFSSQITEDIEAEMTRLRLDLNRKVDAYTRASSQGDASRQQALDLQRWNMEELRRQKERCAKSKEEAQAARRRNEKHGDLEEYDRGDVAGAAGAMDSLPLSVGGGERFRKYTIEEIEQATEFFAEHRKIGEGGYGPVYKCDLDYTPVVVKVLRPDAAHGKAQFQQEVEILSSIRHPHMVLLLGACPEYGCLVYEYMSNGSLADRLFRRGNTPPLVWQNRFRIAAEIGSGLLFLHQAKPGPFVHRDLRPANILLGANYASKISDSCLARFVSSSFTSASSSCTASGFFGASDAGALCYVDPEYQETGVLGVESDIYSFGILLLQLVTGRRPMGLAYQAETCAQKGTLADLLDPAVRDWPLDEALSLATLALRCAAPRRKDRPDLANEVLPELDRLSSIEEDKTPPPPSPPPSIAMAKPFTCFGHSRISKDMKGNPLKLCSRV